MAFWKTNKDVAAETATSPDEKAPATPPNRAGNAATDNNRSASEAGTGSKAAPLPLEQRRKVAAASKMAAATFGEIVSILMRSKTYRASTLGDLEWLVTPAVQSRQFSLAEAQSKSNGLTAPVAVVLWACVSDEVDERLQANQQERIKLEPAEWTSGDNLWVVDAVGDARVVQAQIKRLQQTDWAGRTVKLRTRQKDGSVRAVKLEPSAGDDSAQQ